MPKKSVSKSVASMTDREMKKLADSEEAADFANLLGPATVRESFVCCYDNFSGDTKTIEKGTLVAVEASPFPKSMTLYVVIEDEMFDEKQIVGSMSAAQIRRHLDK